MPTSAPGSTEISEEPAWLWSQQCLPESLSADIVNLISKVAKIELLARRLLIPG